MNISFVNDVFIYCSGNLRKVDFTELIVLLIFERGGERLMFVHNYKNITIFPTNFLFHYTSKMFLEH